MASDAGALLGLLFEHSPVPQFVSRADGSIIIANPAYATLMATTTEAVVGSVPADVTHPDDLRSLVRQGNRLLRHEIDSFDLEVRVRGADGVERWCTATCSLAVSEDGEPLFVTQLVDITARKEAEAGLAFSESRFRILADSLPVGVHRRDSHGRILYVNQVWSDITGISAEDALGQDHLELVHPDDRDRLLEVSRRLAREGGTYHEQFRIVRPDGTVRWVSSRAVWTPDSIGGALGYVGSLEDITDRLAAQEEVQRLAAIAEATSDLVGIVDQRGWVVYANRAARDAYGFDRFGDRRIHSTELYTPESVERFFAVVLPALLEHGRWGGDLDMAAADDKVLRVWQTMVAHLGPDGALRHISAVGRDVTAQKRAQADLAHRATHDVLTGLPNRALLLDELDRAVAADAGTDGTVAVLFLDLDRFKAVNDELGHEAGDELLRSVSGRLASVLRPQDVVARLGGDEFVIVCPDLTGREQAEEIAGRLLRAVSSEPVAVRGRTIAVTASLGVTLGMAGSRDAEGMLRHADAAMYQAKQHGRARFELFEDRETL